MQPHLRRYMDHSSMSVTFRYILCCSYVFFFNFKPFGYSLDNSIWFHSSGISRNSTRNAFLPWSRLKWSFQIERRLTKQNVLVVDFSISWKGENIFTNERFVILDVTPRYCAAGIKIVHILPILISCKQHLAPCTDDRKTHTMKVRILSLFCQFKNSYHVFFFIFSSSF